MKCKGKLSPSARLRSRAGSTTGWPIIRSDKSYNFSIPYRILSKLCGVSQENVFCYKTTKAKEMMKIDPITFSTKRKQHWRSLGSCFVFLKYLSPQFVFCLCLSWKGQRIRVFITFPTSANICSFSTNKLPTNQSSSESDVRNKLFAWDWLR